MIGVSEIVPIIYEANPKQYDYGCVMLHFTFSELYTMHSVITPIHLYSLSGDKNRFGLETDSHITLLYGLNHTVDVNDVATVLDGIVYSNCTLNNISLFKNTYDVLKFDVSGNNLSESNKKLKQLPHHSDYPEYNPHLTIAYLKQGFGERYITKFANSTYSLKPKHIVYAHSNGRKWKLDIKIH